MILLLIGLPNPDNTFTCTLFTPVDGDHSLTSLDPEVPAHPTSEEISRIHEYFTNNFPDLQKLIPDYDKQFLTNPTSALKQITMKPWNLGGKNRYFG
eukprot:TRINITY_DN2228_c0_g1_i2.p2 TRINITY_DN2228_c0_g1~~TRINITY_DN2228_c0_g1_i2.p2  ORF type:complete len:97 (+),score=16.16 TRINITY_DN2228_c0_g1_i2:454-744(+)